jgi:putative transposase
METAARASRTGMAFVTMATHERHPIFELARMADLFIDTLLHYRTQGHYKLHGYTLMPDHVHLLLTPHKMRLDQAAHLIKSGFCYRLDGGLAEIWEPGYKGYSIANLHDLNFVRDYLYQLPVRAHLTPSAELYPYSSAYRSVPVAS